jgi:hypothetical protein
LLKPVARPGLAAHVACTDADGKSRPSEPLTIGQSFEIRSAVVNATRRINVYCPPGFDAAAEQSLPVPYMPDGGMAEDLLHVAGLVQVSVGNNTMRPWLLVGIENTERRRDLTGPTDNGDDRKIAEHLGGSQCFRDFIRTELMPEIRSRYRTTQESGIAGESLAGLFVVESFVRAPGLFDRYVAIDPSLWWNRRQLVTAAAGRIGGHAYDGKALFVATSSDADARDVAELVDARRTSGALPSLDFHYRTYPEETHATVYHPAALTAFRAILSTPVRADAATTADAVSPAAQPRLVDGECRSSTGRWRRRGARDVRGASFGAAHRGRPDPRRDARPVVPVWSRRRAQWERLAARCSGPGEPGVQE